GVARSHTASARPARPSARISRAACALLSFDFDRALLRTDDRPDRHHLAPFCRLAPVGTPHLSLLQSQTQRIRPGRGALMQRMARMAMLLVISFLIPASAFAWGANGARLVTNKAIDTLPPD